MVKVFSIFASVILFFFLQVSRVSANESFETHYDVRYRIAESGNATAELAISLVNKTSDYYASSYKINLSFDDISNVKVSDGLGKIKPDVQKNKAGYAINIPFNQSVVGIGKTLKFRVSFDTHNITQHQGEIWEINIPGLINQEDFDSFTVEVAVPQSFGKPTYIKPSQYSDILVFSKEQLGRSGISIGFGEKQTYDFTLTYHLRNQKIFPVRTEVAIPPTTNYQHVYIDNIDPMPQNIVQDDDGNWLAGYDLSPMQSIDVVVKGKAVLFLNPDKMSISAEERRLYTISQPYWQVSDSKIQKIAKSLKTPKDIYDYVVHALSYDISRVSAKKPRIGAPQVLAKPNSAVCLEFTDLFVALARAAGIPAREVDGFAYTENAKQRPLSLLEDILHAWPEYYDDKRQTWVMVDPTWGNTTGVDYFETLDFDHFAFVIKGLNSEQPVPAGGYKYQEDIGKKDVLVAFAKDNNIQKPIAFGFVPQFPKTIISGIPGKGRVIIKNMGNRVIPSQPLMIQTSILFPREQSIIAPAIPPYGYTIVDATFQKSSLLTNGQDQLTMSYAGKTVKEAIQVVPFFLTPWAIGGIILAISTVSVLIITRKTGRLSFFRRKRQDSLRGEGQES